MLKISVKKILSLVSLVLCLCIALCACTGGKNNDKNTNSSEYKVPENLMTTEEYHSELTKLLSKENMSELNSASLAELDKLGDRLAEMIIYSDTDIKECTGTKYYVSNNGDDNNDGKSPNTAWATLNKVNSYQFGSGDLVLFERGGFWRGYVRARSNVSYSAYGTGPKPKIWNSVDGKAGTWEQTETPNVWMFSEKIRNYDVGTIIYDAGKESEAYGEKRRKKSELKKELDFIHMGTTCEDRPVDQSLLVYCEKGNPGEIFSTIEISLSESPFEMDKNTENIEINNFELLYGSTPFGATDGKNITLSYCVCGWQGGKFQGKGGARYCGGAGAWHGCDTIVHDHCYFYQQFDSGVTPQFSGNADTPSVFKNYITKDCLFEYCEYTLEYFITKSDRVGDKFDNLYFGYNFCRLGGYGFGDKPSQSAYVKSWNHENICENSQIEYNVFDRAAAVTLEIYGHEKGAALSEYSYDKIPKLNNNIYLQRENKKFAKINGVEYKFTKDSLEQYMQGGFDKNSVFFFTNEEEK